MRPSNNTRRTIGHLVLGPRVLRTSNCYCEEEIEHTDWIINGSDKFIINPLTIPQSIKAEKCLGTSLEITTENGDVTVGSNYCEKATFSTVNGDLRLNNLHMDANVCILGSGALKVSCLDGSLQAKLGEGETKVQIVRLSGESHMISKGSVHLVVPKENDVQLNLKGSNLLLDESLSDCKVLHSNGQQVLGTNGKIPLNVETTGDIRVTVASWAETLQIGNFMK